MLDAKNVKIGFIGFGNMAQAMAAGLLLRQAVQPGQLYACAKNWEKLRGNTEPRGMHPCRDAAELVNSCDLVVVAVKPYLVADVLAPVKEQLAGKIVVSVAAGKPFAAYEEILAPGTHHLSTVPNTPISVGEGVIACESRHSLSEEEWALFCDIFGKAALIVPVDTAQLSIAGTLAGCGPAFAAMFIEALADGAVKQGLPRALAYQLASQMVVGTGKLQLATGAHPGAMKDAVCSPGGTTIVGVAALERRGFRGAVIDAIDEIERR